jgi:G3E family GTPase
MTTPVLVVTGFLGAGKTTFINSVLEMAQGHRIAAIVNDFGAINIDADLIAGSTDTVIGLRNGCICCSLQGDLLRTLKLVLAHEPAPETIVIEASGVSDPAGITQALMDPVLWKSARQDAVVCVVDADDLRLNPARMNDDLWRAQLAAASIVVLSKTGGEPDEARALAARLSPSGIPAVFDLARETVPPEVLFSGGHSSSTFVATSPSAPIGSARFVTVDWQAPEPVSLHGLRAAIEEFAPALLRAKGILRFREKPGQHFLLQMVGRRVILEPAPHLSGVCRLVLIGETERLDTVAVRNRLNRI